MACPYCRQIYYNSDIIKTWFLTVYKTGDLFFVENCFRRVLLIMDNNWNYLLIGWLKQANDSVSPVLTLQLFTARKVLMTNK